MPQDRESGRRASEWGRKTGAAIAKAIGARKLRNNSNECIFEGRQVVIKCAHERTRYVGVLSDMLERIDTVIGVFERSDGAFDLRSMSRADYLHLMRTSKSRSHVPNRGQQVRRADFEAHGTYMRTVRIDEPIQ
jgi:hypothetical protein